MQLQKELDSIKSTGIQVVGISYDSVDVLKDFSDEHEITFPLLSDPDSATIVAYALKNEEVAGKRIRDQDLEGIPYPGTMLVDQEGVIRAKLFEEGYKDRHSVDELIKAAEALPKHEPSRDAP